MPPLTFSVLPAVITSLVVRVGVTLPEIVRPAMLALVTLKVTV